MALCFFIFGLAGYLHIHMWMHASVTLLLIWIEDLVCLSGRRLEFIVIIT